jgi:hypothetical protein
VGIRNMWHEVRGTVLRTEYEDVAARMDGANDAAKRAFLNNLAQTATPVVDYYSAAPPADRKAFLKKMRKAALDMWNNGDWPSALGLGISCLNAESQFTPGEAAAYVRRETDRLIKEASTD